MGTVAAATAAYSIPFMAAHHTKVPTGRRRLETPTIALPWTC